MFNWFINLFKFKTNLGTGQEVNPLPTEASSIYRPQYTKEGQSTEDVLRAYGLGSKTQKSVKKVYTEEPKRQREDEDDGFVEGAIVGAIVGSLLSDSGSSSSSSDDSSSSSSSDSDWSGGGGDFSGGGASGDY